MSLKNHNYHAINATIIADSEMHVNSSHRITTFVVTFPRMVLAEFNTHRVFSRNSASSRAIPFKKMVKMVEENPFIPIRWMKDHKGMQGNEYFTDHATVSELNENWLLAKCHAVVEATRLSDMGVTKQFCNRLLEPFMWHTAIVTSTEFENFFALRADENAEIHIQDLAYKMLREYNTSTPNRLKSGEWHIPFGDQFDMDRLTASKTPTEDEMLLVKISTARCARISYMNFEGKDDYEADIRLHDILSKSGHWSPFEHCAKAMYDGEYNHASDTRARLIESDGSYKKHVRENGWSGNIRGFIQYRKMFENENRSDSRVN